ncbi:transposase [Desulfonema ishimotonii]|uniref:Transposase n=1 Tax=Desulfonema ishimotonii TaxID=45657 RepID=A0A401FZU8_9BACT|nr:DUF4277 domain-containing protein [Desulfonema ishimotonii]GBC62466.1 transposase [Desulfonema ishimotonii]
MSLEIKRPDHLGIVAGVIKDLKLIEMIDERIEPDKQEEISTGEAVAGMILNGLGFSQKPLSLTPQFFKNKPIDLLQNSGYLPGKHSGAGFFIFSLSHATFRSSLSVIFMFTIPAMMLVRRL